jgi:hypothetical protein
MNHLRDSEFADLLDGRLAPSRANHAEMCAACRARIEWLRATLADASNDPPAEPSPLFWDHFAARVSDAVRELAIAPREAAWLEWVRHPVSMWAAAAAVTILMIATVAWRATLHAPSGPSGRADGAVVMSSADTHADGPLVTVADIGDDPDADEAWAVVRSAADGLGWAEANAEGLSAYPGSAERAALELTAAERAELVRLLESELKRSGA